MNYQSYDKEKNYKYSYYSNKSGTFYTIRKMHDNKSEKTLEFGITNDSGIILAIDDKNFDTQDASFEIDHSSVLYDCFSKCFQKSSQKPIYIESHFTMFSNTRKGNYIVYDRSDDELVISLRSQEKSREKIVSFAAKQTKAGFSEQDLLQRCETLIAISRKLATLCEDNNDIKKMITSRSLKPAIELL